MWELFVSVTSHYVDPIGIWIGILITIPVFGTWWQLTYGQKSQRRRWFREIQRQPGNRPAILIVDLITDKDITPTVEHYQQQDESLKAVPTERIFSIHRQDRLKPGDIPELMMELRQRATDIIAAGTDTLHCFYAGPNAPCALIGAEFANACRVIIYQHNRGTYDNWGPVRMET